MYDRGLGVLEKYGLTAKTVTRGRGSLICETEQGPKLIREYWGSPRKLEFQRKLQLHCRQEGFAGVDLILENLEGQTVTTDGEGTPYTVRDWFAGRECDTRSREDVMKSVRALAALHKVMQMPKEEDSEAEGLLEECQRHNRELRRIRKFVQSRKRKNDFEEKLASSISLFLEQGERTAEELRNSGWEALRQKFPDSVCHGDCNQHNILMTGQGTVFTNFEKWSYDLQTRDLYQFMRKILEKYGWNRELGYRMIREYDRERSLSSEELLNLKLRLSYPWKFWKLANYYSENNKVWISRKNTEKLEQTIRLAESWRKFLDDFPLK